MSAELYDTGLPRQKAISTSMNAAMRFDLLDFKNADGTILECSIVTPTADNHNAIAGIFEFKNEIGTGGSDPTIQGSLSLGKHGFRARCVASLDSCHTRLIK